MKNKLTKQNINQNQDINLWFQFKKFIASTLKLGFFSWAILLTLWSLKIINFTGSQFLIYTVSALGIGVYKKIKLPK